MLVQVLALGGPAAAWQLPQASHVRQGELFPLTFLRKYQLFLCERQPTDLGETRGGWLRLNVETEANGDSGSTYSMKGVLPWLVRWVRGAGTRDFSPALAALVGPVQNIFLSPYTSLLDLSPSYSQLGRQSCRVVCLLICVFGNNVLRDTEAFGHPGPLWFLLLSKL